MVVLGLVMATAIGLVLGLLGGGGSILSVPILRYVVGEEAHVAVASSLFVVGLTSLVALVPHWRAGRVRWRIGLVFGASSMVGAFAGGRVAHLLPPALVLVLFALVMLVTAAAMLRRRRPRPAGAVEHHAAYAPVLLEGLLVGAVTGLVGAGGGFLVVPALVLLGGLPMSAAVGTSLMVLAMNAFAGFVGHAGSVVLDWPVLIGVSAAALLGSLVGARAVGRVDPDKLRRAFGWLVVAMGLLMLVQELPRLLRDAAPTPAEVALPTSPMKG
ncbi:MAG: sulfite exporter TauE/SafE family protein [Myxococcota bacterium]